MVNTLAQLLGEEPTPDIAEAALDRSKPHSAITHDSVDEMMLKLSLDGSPRFREMTTEDPPLIPPAIEEPEEIDFTTADPEDIKAWQEQARARKEALDNAPPYDQWSDLTGDAYYSLYTDRPPEVVEDVDLSVELHPRIMEKIIAQDEHAKTRQMTAGDKTLTEIATMGMLQELRTVVGEQLVEHVREQQEREKQREEAEEAQEVIDTILPEGGEGEGVPGGSGTATAGEGAGEGQPVQLSPKAEKQLREAEAKRQEALEALGQAPKPMDQAALEALQQAAKAGERAADAAKGMPTFGAGLGAGEPVYTSPEQALSIAERWANNPQLRQMAELFGRMDRDLRFKRSKRAVGGADEITDIKFGDNLPRVLPQELALLGDPETEDDFIGRYTSQELLEFDTIGEEHAGRGPILIVLDGSGSMSSEGGKRNIWARATAMCLLHIARLEKRDFGCIEFSGGNQLTEWMMPAKEPLDGEAVIDMASHIFNGGTTPIIGVQRAAEVMKSSPPFRKADVVLVGDGDAGFGPEDEKLRKQLEDLGVRLFGIGVGPEMVGRETYINKYCEYVVDVKDFDLTDPSAATAELATHIT